MFGKVIGAMVTPFDQDGGINYDVVAELLKRYEIEKHEAIVIGGSTGECCSLTIGEKIDLLQFVRKVSSLKIIMGIHANSTNFAIEEIETICAYRPDGLLLVVPYYNKPPQRGLFLHFKKCAIAAQNTPIILYNVPSRTGITLEFQTLKKLIRINKNIIGLKEASPDFAMISLIKKNFPDFKVYYGNDAEFLKALRAGADGLISVSSILFGHDYLHLMNDFKEGFENRLLSDYLDLIGGLMSVEVNPIPIKYLLSQRGFKSMNLRLPLTEISFEGKKCLDILR